MGGKGGAVAPPTQSAAAPDNSAMMMGMMEMMMGMMHEPAQEQMNPMMEAAPEVITAEPIDWAAQMESLDASAAAKVEADDAERKGRMSTIHSSLTDDDEETEMTTSLLGDTSDEEKTKV